MGELRHVTAVEDGARQPAADRTADRRRGRTDLRHRPGRRIAIPSVDATASPPECVLAAGREVADNDLGAAPQRSATVRPPDIRVTLS